MKTVNCIYTSIESLSSFLDKEGIRDNDALLIQVFAGFSEEEKIKAFQVELGSLFSKATLVGVTSDGNILGGEISELGQTILSFSQFEQTSLSSALVTFTESDFATGKHLGLKVCQPNTQAIIAFSDGLQTNGEDFIQGMSSSAPKIPIAGGMAGDGGKLKNTFVFNLAESTAYGGIAVALNGSALSVHTFYSFGWQSVGKPMQITHAEGNLVYQIDNQPVQAIYQKYFSTPTCQGQSNLGLDFSLFEFPLIKEEEGTLIARAAIFRLEKGGLAFAGNLNKGDQVRFGIGNKEHIISNVGCLLNQLKETPIESVFVYSCTARRRLLGPESIHEIEAFKGLSNVSGFYTYGEFYTQNQQSTKLLNHSMTVMALSESPISRLNFTPIKPTSIGKASTSFQEIHPYSYINSLAAISNFAVNISNDFESLNSKLASEVKKKSEALLRQTLTDDLTQLPGRLSLLQDLQNCFHEVLIIININGFSKINGFYGLDAGDELLSKVAINFKKYLELNEAHLIQPRLYKLPSDEYGILTRVMDLEALDLGMRALNKQVFAQPYQILGFDILVQATWVFSQCEGSAKTLIQAELIAKKARVNKKNFVHYNVGEFKDSQHKIQLAHKVRDAILKNRIYPVFQPIYNNQTGELVKYESLARLKDEDGTVIPPLVFIKVAQMIQMYPIVTEIMIHKTFRAFQGTELCFSVNLSLEDILSMSTQDMIFEAIHCYGVANQVTFEILENQALKDDVTIIQFVNRVKALGAKIAIDDFGSGYANFQHLATLQADYIKIDGALIKTLGQDPVALSVVESMMVFAKKLNIKVIAEFVCNQTIYELVKGKGVDYSQGFYLSEPLDELPLNKISK